MPCEAALFAVSCLPLLAVSCLPLLVAYTDPAWHHGVGRAAQVVVRAGEVLYIPRCDHSCHVTPTICLQSVCQFASVYAWWRLPDPVPFFPAILPHMLCPLVWPYRCQSNRRRASRSSATGSTTLCPPG